MEVKVDRHLIRSEREKRAWSQEHLAMVAGLGLRTVQRIEATGQASSESTKAIAAVLDVLVSDLRVGTESMRHAPVHRRLAIKAATAIGASLTIVMSIFFTRSVLAEDVMLDVNLTLNDDAQEARLLTAGGKDAEIRVDGLLRLVILPTIRPDGSIHLAAEIYESDGNDFVLLSEPNLVTANDKTAEIRIATDRGNTFGVMITPRIQ